MPLEDLAAGDNGVTELIITSAAYVRLTGFTSRIQDYVNANCQ